MTGLLIPKIAKWSWCRCRLVFLCVPSLSPFVSLHLSPCMISILGCPWLPLPPCLPSSSPFMISILGCSWLPLPPCPPSFVFQPCLCSLLPLPPRLPSLFFGNAIWGLCRYNFFFWGAYSIRKALVIFTKGYFLNFSEWSATFPNIKPPLPSFPFSFTIFSFLSLPSLLSFHSFFRSRSSLFGAHLGVWATSLELRPAELLRCRRRWRSSHLSQSPDPRSSTCQPPRRFLNVLIWAAKKTISISDLIILF